MGRTWQRQTTPSQTTPPTSTQAPAGDLRGNQAMCQDLRASTDTPARANNADGSTGQWRDPEGACATGPLPYQGGSWDSDAILARMTQLDDNDATTGDEMSCTSYASLAAYVRQGPGATGRHAREVADEIDSFADAFRGADASRALATSVRRAAEALSGTTGTYADLHTLAHARYWLNSITDGHPGSSPSESRRYGNVPWLGPDDPSPFFRQGSNWQGVPDFRALCEAMADHPGRTLVISFNTSWHLGPGDSRASHSITLGADPDGSLWLYDPWPREGSQRMDPERDTRAVESYFGGAWVVSTWVDRTTPEPT